MGIMRTTRIPVVLSVVLSFSVTDTQGLLLPPTRHLEIHHEPAKTFPLHLSRHKRTYLTLRGGGSGGEFPPVTRWIFPALISSFAFALYNLSIKKASNFSIDPMLGGALLQFVAAIFGGLLYFIRQVVFRSSSTATLFPSTPRGGVLWSVAAGLFVGVAELLSFVVNGMNVPATKSVPVIVGGSVLFGTLLGAVWLKEKMSKSIWVGAFLIASGIACIGASGGGAMH